MSEVTRLIEAAAAGDARAADALGVSVRTAYGIWAYARTWLSRHICSE